MACGASLEPTPTEERRVISILFADLVGFTERSDAADPEDVRRTLIPFHTAAKAAIERFGGTLDNSSGKKLRIDGLWALEFGNGTIGTPDTLLFTAGPNNESHGLFGELTPAGG